MLKMHALLLLLLVGVADACLIKKVCSNVKQCKDLIADNQNCGVDWKEAAWYVGAHCRSTLPYPFFFPSPPLLLLYSNIPAPPLPPFKCRVCAHASFPRSLAVPQHRVGVAESTRLQF